MLNLVVERNYKKKGYTIGNMFANGNHLFNILEDERRELKSSKDKIYGKTAIPEGRYKVTLTKSEKFKNRDWCKQYNGLVPLVNDVPFFSAIRIHPANTADQLLGCLAPGLNKIKGGVINSTECYELLMDNYIMPHWNSGSEIWITIK